MLETVAEIDVCLDEVTSRDMVARALCSWVGMWGTSMYPCGRVAVGYRLFHMVLVRKQGNNENMQAHDGILEEKEMRKIGRKFR